MIEIVLNTKIPFNTSTKIKHIVILSLLDTFKSTVFIRLTARGAY